MHIERIPPIVDGFISVILETPKGSQNKINYDHELELFRLKKSFAMGTVFPFDFGFIPNTLGGDGDPLDVIVIMESPSFPGLLAECTLLGALTAHQKEKNGKEMRNDRLVAVPRGSVLYGNIKSLSELQKGTTEAIERFFVDYNNQQGKTFTPIKWEDAEGAMKLVEEGIEQATHK